MNIIPLKNHAASSTSFSIRSSFATALACGLLLGALGAGSVAQAEPPQPRREEAPQIQQQRFDTQRIGEKHFSDQNDTRAFDSRAEDQRRSQQDRADSSRRNGRLTPDERRDLRRQINEAGQDIYANPPRR